IHNLPFLAVSWSSLQMKVPINILLRGSQMLQMLEKSLRKKFPESLSLWDHLSHNQGNPFKLKALLDKIPDFNTLRSRSGEMTDNPDHYTSTYQRHSKKYQEFLGSSPMISHFPCVGSQSTLNEVIENVAAVKLGKLKQTQCVLCVISERAKKLVPSRMDAKNFAPYYKPHKSRRLLCLIH
uniref:Glycine N-acyltransferase-like protein n=1 Tax=Neovison vison TaxID=452646 RepID=A0A8C7BGA0_NEOVI